MGASAGDVVGESGVVGVADAAGVAGVADAAGVAGSMVEVRGGGVGVGGGLGASDLAELLSSFSEVTGKLEVTHERLRREVERLNVELAEKDEQLARSKRLAALGEMAAGIAHEIRNPLGSIGLYARLLAGELEAGSGARATAEKIAGGVRRLNEIVGDVLSFSRDMRVRPERCGVGELFEEALESCAAELGGVVEVERAWGAGLEVVCDGALVRQAVVNLVRNAAEAMGEVAGARRLRLGAEIRSGVGAGGGGRTWAVLSVGDTGPGIPAGVVERMFNPFFTTRETGTGLGLAIVHRIVDAHGGRVAVFNNAERGGAGRADPMSWAERGATVELLLPQGASAAGSAAAGSAGLTGGQVVRAGEPVGGGRAA